MTLHIEVWVRGEPRMVRLEEARLTIGKDGANDVVISGDRAVSRMHAALEPYAAGWCVRDLGSSNGTFVNGERVWGERPLRAGDEIRVGETRIVLRSDTAQTETSQTGLIDSAPALTPRERDVLVALCRPVLSGDVFTEPSSIREIARTLVVTEAAVKRHLANLYDKFGVVEGGERRRIRLANEAIRRGAVSITALTESP